MNVIFKSYEKVWFLIGLFFMCLGLFSPEEYWYLAILLPLISGLMSFGIKHPVVVLSTNRKSRKLTIISFKNVSHHGRGLN